MGQIVRVQHHTGTLQQLTVAFSFLLTLTACGGGEEATCGNGVVERGDQCDDGNRVDGDGCTSTCKIPRSCGNGRVESGEQCDDGNTVSGDGCSDTCQIEQQPACGDGHVDAGEQCDD